MLTRDDECVKLKTVDLSKREDEWDKRTPDAAEPRAKWMKICYTGTAEQSRGTVCRPRVRL